jgi:hypothetical protein
MILRQLHLREHIEDAYPKSSLDAETSHAEVREMAEAYPLLPDEYLSFLLTVGCGTIGETEFQIYGSAQEPEEIFDERPIELPPSALLVGDNFSGEYIGYGGEGFFVWPEVSESKSCPAPSGITEYLEWWLSDKMAGQE